MRTQEAQAALDNLSVSRNAIKNVLRAQTLMTANSVRIMMEQETMMMGECPDRKKMARLASHMHSKITVKSIRKKGRKLLYSFTEDKSGNPFMLSCADQRVTIVN
ncbi:MAG TPA: hypothetical protein ENJ87_12745 [Gammaproteobacteria bacterium]|nr:hypothetical protein [Gammaproteobacteria bacterium]